VEVAPPDKLAYLLGGFLESTGGVKTPYYHALAKYLGKGTELKPRFMSSSPLYETPLEDIPF
jgi:hypothetical protein